MIRYSFESEYVGKWVGEKAFCIWSEDCTAIGQLFNEKLIAGVMYDNYTKSSISMHFRCDDPKKITKRFYWMAFDYPFNQLKVRRITAMVSTGNVKSQNIVEHLGGRRETTLADYFPDGDAIIYRMYRDECRCLNYGSRYAIRPLLAAA